MRNQERRGWSFSTLGHCRYNWYTLWESVWAGKGGLNRRVILSVQQTFVLANSKIISGSRGVTVRGNELVAWYPVRSLQ